MRQGTQLLLVMNTALQSRLEGLDDLGPQINSCTGEASIPADFR